MYPFVIRIDGTSVSINFQLATIHLVQNVLNAINEYTVCFSFENGYLTFLLVTWIMMMILLLSSYLSFFLCILFLII